MRFFFTFSLTCVYSYVSDKLAGLFESLSAMMAAVCESTTVDVFLVVSGARGKRPVKGVNTHTMLKCFYIPYITFIKKIYNNLD